MLFLWTRAVTFFTIRNLNQMLHDATSVVEKNKIETDRLDEQRYRVFIAMRRWARTVSVPRFLVFPAAAKPRSRKVHESSPLVVDDRMAGSGKRAEAQKKRDKRNGGRKGEKKEKRRKGEEEIVHLSSCKVGKMDGTRNLPTLFLRGCALASFGHNLQFLTIRLDQPPYKRTYYVTTLRRDSHERSDAR